MNTITKKKRIRKAVNKKKGLDILDPKQTLFIALYTDPKSPTFGNSKQTALKAGYKKEYAENLIHLNPNWLSNYIGDERRLKKSERNLEEVQNIPLSITKKKEIRDNKTNELIDVIEYQEYNDSQLIALRTKTDMFLAERLDKVKYSTRSENAHIVKVEHSIDEDTRKKLDSLLNL